jgi:cell division protein FtsB
MVLRPTRLLALGGLVVVVLLYWKPIRHYQHARAVLHNRQAEVARLQRQQQQLQARLAAVSRGDTLIREARRLGLVKPGEQLFIVRGIAAWRDKHH